MQPGICTYQHAISGALHCFFVGQANAIQPHAFVCFVACTFRNEDAVPLLQEALAAYQQQLPSPPSLASPDS
eukprot:scaffold197147_cov22-Tisochrysis_lutea.AAC.1